PGTEYDVISALPDSVVQRPLGLIEEREPRDAGSPGAIGAEGAPAAARTDRSKRLPAKLEPQLATLVASVPAGDWIVEPKFDGYRLLARIDGAGVRLFTRKGNDWTAKLQPIADAVAELGLTQAWLDGEIVVLDDA
ncbi:hypothetical protein VXM49_22970, partial [Xanthomonas citri pv. citri]